MTPLRAILLNGFSLLELMVTLVIASLLTALAVPSYSGFVDRARIARAIDDIRGLGAAIDKFGLDNDPFVRLV